MKTVFFLLFFSVTALFAESTESKIMKLIFDSLYGGQKIAIYTKDIQKNKIIIDAGFLSSSVCSKADIVYGSELYNECDNKPLFTDNYQTLKEEKNAIGAFYWTKGRPNILFLKSRLGKFGLKIPTNLQKYIIEEL